MGPLELAVPPTVPSAAADKILGKYHSLADVLDKENVDTLPSHCKDNCPIDPHLGAEIPFGYIHTLSKPQFQAFCVCLQVNLQKGFI